MVSELASRNEGPRAVAASTEGLSGLQETADHLPSRSAGTKLSTRVEAVLPAPPVAKALPELLLFNRPGSGTGEPGGSSRAESKIARRADPEKVWLDRERVNDALKQPGRYLKEGVHSFSCSAQDLYNRASNELRNYILPWPVSKVVVDTMARIPGTPKSEAEPALPGYKFSFPRDEAAHDSYKTEWWYYNGHLKSESGHDYGYELTFFRHKIFNQNFYSAHLALSDVDQQKFRFQEKSSVLHPNSAGASASNYYVWNGDWQAKEGNGRHLLQASTPEFSIQLNLDTAAAPVIHGIDGVSQKGDGRGVASHYYSRTRMPTDGFVIDHGRKVHVSGDSWMDHEFGSDMMARDASGWDWFSVKLENNSQLMLYLLKHNDGTVDQNSSGTIVNADGSTKHLKRSDFSIQPTASWHSPDSGANYPAGWQVKVPGDNIELSINPTIRNQELLIERSTGVTYWEGDCSVLALVGGKAMKGQAYIELAGYAQSVSKLPELLKP